MLFPQPIIDGFLARLEHLGIVRCPLCGCETLYADARPVWLHHGGAEHDPHHLIRFLFSLSCEICGHVMLFDVEKHHPGDEPIFAPAAPAGD